MLKFEDRFQFQEWLGELLDKSVGSKVEDISGESSEHSGHCKLEIQLSNGDIAELNIKMFDKDYNEK